MPWWLKEILSRADPTFYNVPDDGGEAGSGGTAVGQDVTPHKTVDSPKPDAELAATKGDPLDLANKRAKAQAGNEGDPPKPQATPQATPEPIPQKPEPKKEDKTYTFNTKYAVPTVLDGLSEDLLSKIADPKFDPAKLGDAEWKLYVGSLRGKELEKEIKRSNPDYDPEKIAAEFERQMADDKARQERLKKYEKLAKDFQKGRTGQQPGTTQEPEKKPENAKTTTQTPSTAPVVRLSAADVAKELGIPEESYNEFPENMREAFRSKFEAIKTAEAQAIFDKTQAEKKAKEAEALAEKNRREFEKAKQSRDMSKQQVRQYQREYFEEAAIKGGIPQDLRDLAFDQAMKDNLFVDKQGKGRNLKDVLSDLKGKFPTMFSGTAAPKPQGNIGSSAGSHPPVTDNDVKTTVDYSKEKGDPLEVAKRLAQDNLRKANLKG